MMKKLAQSICGVLATFLIGCSAANSGGEGLSLEKADAAASEPGFRPVSLGGGGFVVDMDYSPDGKTLLARTDVHGAYIWDVPSARWKQLITSTSLPLGDQLIRGGSGIGAYAIRVAPSDSARLYLASPAMTGVPSYIYRSDDRGAHWVRTRFVPVEMSVQSEGRSYGPKMAIDPANPDVVLVGDSKGRVHRTEDGGASWTVIDESQLPAGPEPAIAFSAAERASIGRTSTVYATTGTNGVYRSTDNGLHWARTAGGPRSIARMVAAPDGLYVTDRDQNSLQNAWKLSSERWDRLSIAGPGQGNTWHSIAVDPRNPRTVVLGSSAGNIVTSNDGGRSWGAFFNDAADRVAKDIPWLGWTLEGWMSNGNMMFDPVVPGRLYFAEGIGMWYTQPKAGDSKPSWTSQTRGIDELIINDLIVPPGGKPILAAQDRGLFRIESPELFPETHGPDRDVPIRHSWSVDYAAGDPAFIAHISNGGAADRSGYSTDGGRSWTPFASNRPANAPGHLGGTIAVSTAQNMVWMPANNGRTFYTLDGGKTWQIATFPAQLPTAPESGWSFSFYQNRHVLAADRVVRGTFYAYNYGPATATGTAGTYRSTDGGASWTKVGNGFGIPGSMGTSARLAAVPGKAGHLFFAVGTTGLTDRHPYDVPLKHSRDGGLSWKDLRKTQEVWAIGFGKAAPGMDYPALYIAGFANGDGEPAIYRSIDEGASWQKLVSYPFGNIDAIRAISGDMNAYGRIYYGFSGSGAGYGVIPN